MCPLRMIDVEIDGKVVSRLRSLRILQADPNSPSTVACFQPSLRPGERLVERPGQIPMIVRDAPCSTES